MYLSVFLLSKVAAGGVRQQDGLDTVPACDERAFGNEKITKHTKMTCLFLNMKTFYLVMTEKTKRYERVCVSISADCEKKFLQLCRRKAKGKDCYKWLKNSNVKK